MKSNQVVGKPNVAVTNGLVDALASQMDSAIYLHEHLKDSIKYSGSTFYVWNETIQLWDITPKNFMQNIISEFFRGRMKELVSNASSLDEQRKYVSCARQLGNSKHAGGICDYCESLFFDKTFTNTLDMREDVVNFKNGLVNLRNGEFRPRIMTDFFTKALSWDYNSKPSTKTIKQIKEKFIRMTGDNVEHLTFMFHWLAYSITGNTDAQKFLYFLGYNASNGKSTFLTLMHNIFEFYVVKMGNNTFDAHNSTRHKQLIHAKSPARLIYIEELSSKLLDTNLMKDLVSGQKLNVEKLYSTCESFSCKCKLILASNNNPRYITDAGIRRRGLVYEFTNQFVEMQYADPKNKKYPIEDIVGLFESDVYKNALFSILLEQTKIFYKEGLQIPQFVRDGFSDICEINDTMKQFIEKYFVQTKDMSTRISKEEFVILYNAEHGTKQDFIDMLKDIKRLGLSYNKELRCHGRKGCIVGIRRKTDTEMNESDDDEEPEPELEVKPTKVQKKKVVKMVGELPDNEEDDYEFGIKKEEPKKVVEKPIEIPERLHTNKQKVAKKITTAIQKTLKKTVTEEPKPKPVVTEESESEAMTGILNLFT